MIRHIIISGILCIGLLASFSSCSKEGSQYAGKVPAPLTMDISVRSGETDVDLDFTCYAFRRETGTGSYTLYDVISPLDRESELPWALNEIGGHEFRLLFVALPSGEKPLQVVDDSDSEITEGVEWDDISVMASTLELPLHCYYGVKTVNGDDIIADEGVSCTLQRIVGQMVFDFYKVDADDALRTPIAINSAVAKTVMDRIRQIEVAYSGLTNRLIFDDTFSLTASADPTKDTLQTVVTTLNGFAVELPQPEGSALTSYKEAPGGSARVNGFYMFPSENVKATMTVTYYDTTPSCGIKAHAHTESCFDGTHVITLNVPEKDNGSPLTVISNHITRNKAMIRCDRVIDIPQTNGFGFDVEWGVK